MSLGQRVRRSWPHRSVLCSTTLALIGGVALLGLPQKLVSPYRSAATATPQAAKWATQQSAQQGTPGRLASSRPRTGTPTSSRLRPTSAHASALAAEARSKGLLGLGRSDSDLTQGSLGTSQDDIEPTWTPDGRNFVFSSTWNTGTEANPPMGPFPKVQPPPPPDMTTGQNASGARPLQTTGSTTGGDAAPDISTIPQYSVYMEPNGGGGATQLTRRTGNQLYPALNGATLLYIASPEADPPQPVVPPDTTTGTTSGGLVRGGARPQQAAMVGPVFAPAALPWTLAISSTAANRQDDGREIVTPVTIAGVVNAERPSWAPDGTQFVVAGQDSKGQWDLYVGSVSQPGPNADLTTFVPGASVRKITFSGTVGGALNDPNFPDEVDPVWSPDGKWIAFTRGKVTLHGSPKSPGKSTAGWDQTEVPTAKDPRRAYLEYKGTHIWIAPVRGGQQLTSLGQPRQITNFSVLRQGIATPLTAIEYLPAWTPSNGLAFTSNRQDVNGDRLPDDVGTTTSIFMVFNGLEAEATSAPVIYQQGLIKVVSYTQGRNLARKETFSVPAPESSNEEYPSYNSSVSPPAEINENLIYQVDLDPTAKPGGAPAPLDPNTVPHDIWQTVVGSPGGGGFPGGGTISDNVFQLQGTPSVTPRLAEPGTAVRIEVKAFVKTNIQFLHVADVFAIIRDPDQKIFSASDSYVDSGTAVQIQQETGSQAIDVVPLFDDGPNGGHGDRVAGDGTYSNNWVTPNVARDYYVDIGVRGDRSLGGTGPFGGALAFDYFDNVWGFTTQQFSPHTNLLFVSDYTAGQKFVVERFPGKAPYSIFPVESYFTERPHPYFTTDPNSPALQVYTWGYPSQDIGWGVLGLNSPYEDDFDIWRTQCRDAFPVIPPEGDPAFYKGQSLTDALNYYRPHLESGFSTNGSPKQIKVSDRGIVWASPYTGNLTVGPDTIESIDVQNLVADYLSDGGRMFLTGQDVAWALTQSGRVTNKLLSNYFKATYLDDADEDVSPGGIPFAGNRHTLTGVASDGETGIANGLDPITEETWSPHWAGPDAVIHRPTTAELTGFRSACNPPFGDKDCKTDAAWDQYYIDGIQGAGITLDFDNPTPAGTIPQLGVPPDIPRLQYTYATQVPQPASDITIKREAGIIYQDSLKNFKTVFFGFGFEGIHRHYETLTVPPGSNRQIFFAMNRPAQIMHNIVCWLRQGSVSGQVIDSFLGRPLPGAVVTVYLPTIVNNVQVLGAPVGAGVTDINGNYSIIGLEPKIYTFIASKPGFTFQHREEFGLHGGKDNPGRNLAMSRLDPGNIKGQLLTPSGQPVVGARIEMRMVKEALGSPPPDVANGPFYSTTTDASGNFFQTGTQVGIYEVSAKINDLVVALKTDVRVSTKATTTVNLTTSESLQATHITGQVLDSNNATVAAIQVTATGVSGTGSQTLTDASGNFALDLTPGDYVLKAVNGAGAQASQTISVGAAAQTVRLVLGQSGGSTGNQITFNAGINMISLPAGFSGQDFAALLNQSGFQLATWDGTTYQSYPNEPAKTVQSGRGYFLRLQAPVTLTLPTGGTANPSISLVPGWNLIGNPYTASVALGSLRVMQNGKTFSFTEATGNHIIDSSVWTLSGSDYTKATSLDPGKGYWLYSQSTASLLVLPPATSTSALQVAAVRNTKDWGQGIRSLSEWMDRINGKTR